MGSVGADYILQNGTIRPTLGIAYLQDDVYVGGDVGLDLAGGPLHFGLGFGATNTADPTVAPVVVTPPLEEEVPVDPEVPQCAVSCG